jgi:hypothetical protein
MSFHLSGMPLSRIPSDLHSEHLTLFMMISRRQIRAFYSEHPVETFRSPLQRCLQTTFHNKNSFQNIQTHVRMKAKSPINLSNAIYATSNQVIDRQNTTYVFPFLKE